MIEKFEKKVNNLKRKINKKALAVIVFMVFGAFSIYAMEMTNNFKRQKQQVQDEYNKAMYAMIGYISNVEVELAKLQITNTPKMTSTTLASIWKQSNLAKENLESLPSTQNALSNAAKYLSQLSDFSYTLLKQTVENNMISDEQYEQIAELYKSSKSLGAVMTQIYDDLNNGRVKWDEVENISNEKLEDTQISTAVANISNIEKTFQEYEGLIYDGAFSDHLLTKEAKLLSDKVVPKEEVEKNIENIFGKENIEYLNFVE